MNADALENHTVNPVLSGAAMIACLGTDRHAVWQAVAAGRCGVMPLKEIEPSVPAGARGGEAPSLVDLDDAKQSREIRYLRRAMRDALTDAGFAINSTDGQFQFPYSRHRCAVLLGTTLHGIRGGGDFLRTGDSERLRHFLAAAVLRAATDGLGLHGPALTTCSACSSSLGSIALGVTLLEQGQVDLVVAGGYDPISEYAYGGFNSLRLVTATDLRPFARDRAGMKVGEGYGIVILERADDLRRRGREPLAYLLGFGESADAHHLTQPHPQGDGAARAIAAALASAGLSPQQIDLMAAHATGTPDNDAAEYAAIRKIFGDDLPRLPVVAFKSHLAHTLGAAGAVELILSAMALSNQTILPCANIGPGDSDFAGLRLATGSARPAPLATTMNLSLGFGGANTCVILSNTQPPARKPISPREVFITGIGVALPGAMGNQTFLARLNDPSAARAMGDAAEMDQAAIETLLSARRVRRMSGYVKLSLAAAMLALADANIADVPAFCESASAILGTTHAGAQYCVDYYGAIVRDTISAANPMLFAEGVPNAAAAHLSLATGMKGGCQTIIGSRTAGLDALGLAAARIAGGTWDRALVVAADEFCAVVNAGYAHCGVYAPTNPALPFAESPGTFVAGWGGVGLILESKESLDRRGGGKIRGSVLKYSAGSGSPQRQIQTADHVLAELADPAIIISAANGTWLDRAIAGALRASARRAGRQPSVGTLGSLFPECFSAGPLAAIAAMLLGGRFPAAHQEWRKIDASTAGEDFVSLASDYNGPVAGVLIRASAG